MSASGLRPYLTHMRLPFQATLAPIFLWGWLLAGAPIAASVLLAFVSLHLFLYPAATAFNSAYDRDEGPVGGLEAPPRVPEGLARFAAGLALAGALPAAAAGIGFFIFYTLSAGWTAAYSHPATRWKASPWKSSLAIGLGQGVIGFAAGWAAAAPIDLSSSFLGGAVSSALTALGLYPLTQVFQRDEDRARGDRTLVVTMGERRALRFGGACLCLAGLAAAWTTSSAFGAEDAAIVLLAYAALVVSIDRFARSIGAVDPRSAYRGAMLILNVATAGFLLFLAVEAARGSGIADAVEAGISSL